MPVAADLSNIPTIYVASMNAMPSAESLEVTKFFKKAVTGTTDSGTITYKNPSTIGVVKCSITLLIFAD